MPPPTPRPIHRTLDPMRYSSSLPRSNQYPRKRKAAPWDSPVHGPESSESEEEPDKAASKAPQKPKDEEPEWEDAGIEFVKLIDGKERKEFIHKLSKTSLHPNFNVKGIQARAVSELVGLYIFADRNRCTNRLKNNVMNVLQDKMATQRQPHLFQETMKRIFDNTTSTKEAPIRKFCAALMTFALFKSETMTTESLQDIQVNIPELHLACLNYQREVSHCKCYGTPLDIESDLRKRGRDNRRGFGECYFHIHTTERACDD